jgi:hypothetical protein
LFHYFLLHLHYHWFLNYHSLHLFHYFLLHLHHRLFPMFLVNLYLTFLNYLKILEFLMFQNFQNYRRCPRNLRFHCYLQFLNYQK